MALTLLLVAILTTAAYTAGYLIGRADNGTRRHTLHSRHLTQHVQLANIDRPGNPRLN
jgi:ABC-type transport system substrate-binding protein